MDYPECEQNGNPAKTIVIQGSVVLNNSRGLLVNRILIWGRNASKDTSGMNFSAEGF